MEMEYLQLRNNDVVPALDHLRPFKCVLLIDSDFSTAWQKKISERLVKSGCYYLMPWGKNASSWNDAIDSALLAQFNYQAIPAESSIMTSWYDYGSTMDLFAFCKGMAKHEVQQLDNTLVLHISETDRAESILRNYCAAGSLHVGGKATLRERALAWG